MFLFLHKNAEIIEAEGIRQKFKIIYSDAESQYIKHKLKDNLVIEFKKDYFVIDFEKFPDLAQEYYDHLKEENFDDLNDYYFYNYVARQDKRSLDAGYFKGAKNIGSYNKIPSKFSLMSTEHDVIDPAELNTLEIALLDTPWEEVSNDKEYHTGRRSFAV